MRASPRMTMPCRPADVGQGVLLLALGMAVSASAGVGPASAPDGQAAAVEPSACAASLRAGGAAPPTIAPADLRARVEDVMRHHRIAPWTVGTAVALRDALCLVGAWRQPGLDAALSPWGLSLKQIEASASAGQPRPAAPATAGSAAPRRIPPRE